MLEIEKCINWFIEKKINFILKYVDKEVNYFNILKDRINLINNTNLTIIEIENNIRKKYNIIQFQNKQHIEYMVYFYYIIFEFFNIIDKDRYKDCEIETIKNNMEIRIELYKNGFNINNIENYMNKYIYEEKNIFNSEIYYIFNYLLDNIIKLKNIIVISKGKGRPKIPLKLNEIIKNKKKIKMRNIMSKKYKIINNIKEIKLTKNDINYLLSLIKDNKELTLKLELYKEYL